VSRICHQSGARLNAGRTDNHEGLYFHSVPGQHSIWRHLSVSMVSQKMAFSAFPLGLWNHCVDLRLWPWQLCGCRLSEAFASRCPWVHWKCFTLSPKGRVVPCARETTPHLFFLVLQPRQ
jgi:hypothetical protein